MNEETEEKQKCVTCDGEEVVVVGQGTEDEKVVVCPDCYEEEDYSGATEGDDR